jgi:cysteine-rich repeat protein
MVADGTVCDLGGMAAAGICVAGSCNPTSCGDRIVTGTEQCDDGANANDNDGCKNDCTFTCQRDEDCDDTNECDGAESCLVGLPGMRVCREALAIPPNGTRCEQAGGASGTCMGGVCE